MSQNSPLPQRMDWVTTLIFAVLVLAGWLNIYAAAYDPEINQGIFDFTTSAGKQLIWIGTAVLIARAIFFFDFHFFSTFAFIFYSLFIAFLLFVLLFGREVAGSRSWIGLGELGIQPSEFAKFATALALAKYLNRGTKSLTNPNTLLMSIVIISLPLVLITLQGDTGTALVFGALIIPLFREGLPPILPATAIGIALIFILTLLINQTILLIATAVLVLLGVGLNTRNPKRLKWVIIVGILTTASVRSVDFTLNEVLKPYQQKRILSLVNPSIDPLGAGWNVTQSKIAIGSGGFSGKGFLQGTQTKFNFVPEQTTDFIFCTIGEEHGWLGSTILLTLFAVLLLRLTMLAERQKSVFARIYGYGVIAILFFHFAINIAMTIGLFPVIGIPLPFFSYGGSSLWAFTVLLFIFLKLDSHRMQVLKR